MFHKRLGNRNVPSHPRLGRKANDAPLKVIGIIEFGCFKRFHDRRCLRSVSDALFVILESKRFGFRVRQILRYFLEMDREWSRSKIEMGLF